MRITRLVAAVALLGPWLCGASGAAEPLKATIDKLGGQPCRVGNLTCVSVEVPVDYRANTGPRIKIEYAVSFASGESKGILFYLVGGPGGSGLGVADDYLAAFDARLTENMDIVFFDQRGVGPDHGLECPKAQGVFDMTTISVDRPHEAIAAAKAFAADCPAELKSRDLLGFVDTEVAIRDLEEFGKRSARPRCGSTAKATAPNSPSVTPRYIRRRSRAWCSMAPWTWRWTSTPTTPPTPTRRRRS